MPARNGAEANQTKPRPDIKKWPAYFQELGYEVAAFGKVSHYGHTRDYGFDHFEHDTFHDPEGIPSAVQYLKHRRSAPFATPLEKRWGRTHYFCSAAITARSGHLRNGIFMTPASWCR